METKRWRKREYINKDAESPTNFFLKGQRRKSDTPVSGSKYKRTFFLIFYLQLRTCFLQDHRDDFLEKQLGFYTVLLQLTVPLLRRIQLPWRDFNSNSTEGLIL
ncbi:hypothetical protein SDJN02_24849, partial [Cucurbita argyrosperma subsp. argyrosperma]